MDLLGAIFEEHAHIVAQLCASDDGIVAEDHPLAVEQRTVWNEFHFGHEITPALVARCEASGPGGCVLEHSALIRDAMSLGIAQCHAHAGVGNAAYAVGLHLILLAEDSAVSFPHFLHVDAIVVGSGESVVDPEEGAYLLMLGGGLQHLHALGSDFHYLARPHVAHRNEVEVREGRRLACSGPCPLFLSDNDGRTSEEVARGDDGIFGEHEHGAGALHLLIHLVDTVDEGGAHVDEQCHQLCGIDFIGRELTEVHPFGEQFVGYLANIVDFGHRDHRITSQVGVDNDGLRVGIADDAQSLVTMKGIEFIFELGAEVVALQTVYGTAEASLGIESDKPRTLGAQMRIIICSVEQVVDAILDRYGTEKASHEKENELEWFD